MQTKCFDCSKTLIKGIHQIWVYPGNIHRCGICHAIHDSIENRNMVGKAA